MLDRRGTPRRRQPPNSHQMLKMGFKNDGKIIAIDLTSYGTAGGSKRRGRRQYVQDQYECPNFRTAQYDVFTHASTGAAFGHRVMYRVSSPLEQVIDGAAERLGWTR